MTLNGVLVDILLAIGIAGCLLSAIGFLVVGKVHDQIHFLAPASVIGGVAIPLAILLREGFSEGGVKAILICATLLLANPVLSHATARAERIRRRGRWQPAEEEAIPIERRSEQQ